MLKVGELLINNGVVKDNDIHNALQIQKEEKQLSSMPLTTILIQLGYLTLDQFQILMAHPMIMKILCDWLIDSKVLGADKIKKC